jgi:hypothetical protein
MKFLKFFETIPLSIRHVTNVNLPPGPQSAVQYGPEKQSHRILATPAVLSLLFLALGNVILLVYATTGVFFHCRCPLRNQNCVFYETWGDTTLLVCGDSNANLVRSNIVEHLARYEPGAISCATA